MTYINPWSGKNEKIRWQVYVHYISEEEEEIEEEEEEIDCDSA